MKDTKDIQLRKMQVYSHFSPRRSGIYTTSPQIRLIGKWLKDAGFEVNDKIKIVVSKRCLVIIPDENKQEDL